MKKVLTMLGLAVAAAVGVSAGESSVRVTIPFEFKAGEKIMPPGKYRIERYSVPNTLLLTNRQTGTKTLLVVDPVVLKSVGDDGATVVFNKYDDHRIFLSQIRVRDWSSGAELHKTKLERELIAKGTSPSLLAVTHE